jgi:hypothetical protein
MLIHGLEIKYSQSGTALDSVVDSVQKAPGAMQSHHDTSKIEGSWLADGMNDRLESILRSLTYAKSYSFPLQGQKVQEGSYVVLEPVTAKFGLNVILFPFSSEGIHIDHQGIDIMPISLDSPLAVQLMGKKIDDTVKVRSGILKITEMY